MGFILSDGNATSPDGPKKIPRAQENGFHDTFIFLICCFFFLLRFFLLQEGYRFLAPFGFILFISIKYRKVMVGLLTPGYRIMRYDDGSCVSRSKVLFLWFFFVSCIIFTFNCYAPLVLFRSIIFIFYKLVWLDYGVSLFFFVVTYGLP